MNMPGFNAEFALSTAGQGYRQSVNARTGGSRASVLEAAMISTESCRLDGTLTTWEEGVGWRTTNIYKCTIDLGGSGGGGGPIPDPSGPGGGGGGGGGGGRTPASVPGDIVKECRQVGGRFGEKYCGGLGGPSSCKTCAQIVCQQKKCDETQKCDPAQLNGRKETMCNVGCPDKPGICKDGLAVKSSVMTRSFGGVFGRI